MNFSSFSIEQLCAVIPDRKLARNIRELAGEELKQRGADAGDLLRLFAEHRAKTVEISPEGLGWHLKLILLLLPFIVPVQSVFAARWLAMGQQRKWKQYWFYLAVSYLAWTVIVILAARYSIFFHHDS